MSTGADVTQRPGSKRSAAATARAILEAARLHFARQGFDRTGVREIAADAGVDQALVLRYFRSKEQLFVAACASEPVLPEVFSGPREELPKRLLEWVSSLGEAGGESQFLTLIRSSSYEIATKLLRQWMTSFTEQLATAVDQGHADLRADLIASFLLGIAVMRRHIKKSPLKDATAEELARYFVPATAILCSDAKRTQPAP